MDEWMNEWKNECMNKKVITVCDYDYGSWPIPKKWSEWL